ncbi:hypothetical protein VN12_23520 [Pirellula sp. SH-Sr6A]|nr:hypothetical protein VN12_23520 [Pirellula sp. SH-Sr6A]
MKIDPSGLDTTVCAYPDALMGAGHMGYKVSGEKRTKGVYPNNDYTGSTAVVIEDPHDNGICYTIETTKSQEECLVECRERWDYVATYNAIFQNCTHFVVDCFRTCGLPATNARFPFEVLDSIVDYQREFGKVR